MRKMIFISNSVPNPRSICPDKGETVTVFKSRYFDGMLEIVEYPSGEGGLSQDFHPRHFREPQTNTLSKELAEEFLEQDSKVREVEHERVFSLTENF